MYRERDTDMHSVDHRANFFRPQGPKNRPSKTKHIKMC